MALHAPAQHAGQVTHHWLRDILIVGAVVVVTIAAVWAFSGLRFASTSPATEAQQLVEYRAAERADALAGVAQHQPVMDYRLEAR